MKRRVRLLLGRDGERIAASIGWSLCVLSLALGVEFAILVGFAPAAEGGPPAITDTVAEGMTEHSATVKAWIDPHGEATSYEQWLTCAGVETMQCEPVTPQEQGGWLAAGDKQEVSVVMTGLRAGYRYQYGVSATNAAGKTEIHWGFGTLPDGSCVNGCPWTTETSYASYQQGIKFGEEAPQRAAAREAQEAAERAEREALHQNAPAPSPSADAPAPPATGTVWLSRRRLSVAGGRSALVELECLGSQRCLGGLTLSARGMGKASGRGRRAHATTLGVARYSIPGDGARTLRVPLDAAGRALLRAGRGRFDALLAVRELAPGPTSTSTTAVSLVRERSRR